MAVVSAAARKTTDLLADYGVHFPYRMEDIAVAERLVMAYAKDPGAASRLLTETKVSSMSSSALRSLDAQLRAFSGRVVENAEQVRNYVTNKLLEESDNPDPRIRIRALELLGKISEVGLFAERREVTVTHTTTSEIRDALKAKLARLSGDVPADQIEDAIIVEEVPEISVAALDAAWDDEDE